MAGLRPGTSRMRGDMDADMAVAIAMASTPQTVNPDRLRVDTLKWRSGKLNPRFSDRRQVEVSGRLTFGEQWLQGIIEADEIEAREDPAALPPGDHE